MQYEQTQKLYKARRLSVRENNIRAIARSERQLTVYTVLVTLIIGITLLAIASHR